MISNNNLSNDNTVITGHNEKLAQEHLENNGEKTPNKRWSMIQPKEATRPTHRTKRFTRQDKKKGDKKNVEQKKDKPHIPLKKHGQVVKNTPNKIAFKNRKKMEKKEKFGQMKDNNVKSNYAEIALRKQEVKKNVEQQRKKHERFKKNIDTQLVDDFIEAVNAKRKQEAERQRKELERVKKITNDRLLKNINDSVEVARAKGKQEVAKKVEPEKELNKARPPRKSVIVRNLRNDFDLVAGEDRHIETADGSYNGLKIKKINFTQRDKEIIYDKSNIYDSDEKTHPGEVNNLKLNFKNLNTQNSGKIQNNSENITDSDYKSVNIPKKKTQFKFDEKYFPSEDIKFDKKKEEPKNGREDIKNLKDRDKGNNKSKNK